MVEIIWWNVSTFYKQVARELAPKLAVNVNFRG